MSDRSTSYNYPEQSDKEPADPEDVDHDERRETRLSPSVTQLQNTKIYTECGCGDCHDLVDPLYEIDSQIRSDFYADDECNSPEPMTLERAREVYIVYQQFARNQSEMTSGYERHRHGHYARIMAADRHFRAKYDGLTTVMLTRRIHPLDADENWICPTTLDSYLHTDKTMKRVRKSVNYRLGTKLDLEFEYLRVTAVTKGAATPHEHRYFWVDDPENEIGVEHFEPALEDHLEYTPRAFREHHEIDPHGEEGAITVRHSPPLVDETPERADAIREACMKMNGVDTRLENTQGAQYIASQLSHLFLGDKFDRTKETPVSTLIEGGAIDLATPSRWVGFSRGIPKLEER